MQIWKGRNMKRTWNCLLLGILLSVAGVGTTALAQEEVTVKGEVLDMSCYMAKGAKGPEHRACAQTCVQKGAPIGILTGAGDVYLLVDDHDNPDAYEAAKKLAGDQAEITGKKFSRGGATAIVGGKSKGL